MTTLKKFIQEQLERSLLRDDYIEKLVSEKNLATNWTKCFTHKSVDFRENYENFEFMGDKIVNSLASIFVWNTYLNINTPVWRTKIHHYIVSNKILGKIGREKGFEKFLRVSDEHLESIRKYEKIPENKNVKDHKKYIGLIEDTVESFFGCLMFLLGKEFGMSIGASTEICSRILFSYYRSIDIDISYKNIFDPATRLKELYQSNMRWYEHVDIRDKEKIKRKTKYFFVKQEQKGDHVDYTVTVYAWPLGDRQVKCDFCHSGTEKRNDPNRVVVAVETGDDEEETKMRAFESALETLKKKYDIFPTPPPMKS